MSTNSAALGSRWKVLHGVDSYSLYHCMGFSSLAPRGLVTLPARGDIALGMDISILSVAESTVTLALLLLTASRQRMWVKFEQEKKLVGGHLRRLQVRREVSQDFLKWQGNWRGKVVSTDPLKKKKYPFSFLQQPCKARWHLIYNWNSNKKWNISWLYEIKYKEFRRNYIKKDKMCSWNSQDSPLNFRFKFTLFSSLAILYNRINEWFETCSLGLKSPSEPN